MTHESSMKSIWYFVGLMLMAMGFVVLCAGVYYYINPAATTTKLNELHPSLWWAACMIVAGSIFYFTQRKK